MPFYGNAFFGAMRGYSNDVVAGYIRCLWHYWHHTHVQGLSNEDDFLRRLCECDASAWVRTKGVIFDNNQFFVLEGDKWHQKRCREEYIKIEKSYTSAINRGKSGASARWSKHKTEQSPVQSPVHPPSSAQAMRKQWESESESESDIVHTLSPTSLSLSKPSPPATSVCVSVSKKKQQDDLNGRLQWFAIQLCGMYKREEKRFALGEEEHLALDISRRHSLPKELKEIQAYRNEIGERFFPQSMLRLLQQWTDTLDKARNHKPAPQPFKELSIAEKELRQIRV